MRIGEFCRCDHLLVRGVQLAIPDIFHHGCRKQMRILQYDTKGTAQVCFLDLIDIDVIISDLTILNIIKPIDQIRDRCLARTS